MRLTKRDLQTSSIVSRILQNPIQLGNTSFATLSFDPGDEFAITATTTPDFDYVLFGFAEISLYENSIADENQIGVGSNIDESNWQILGPFNDWGTTDNYNLKSNIFIRSTESAPNFEKQISQNSDDCEENGGFSSSACRFGNQGGTSYDGGYRFTSVNVPQGATINDAKVVFNKLGGGGSPSFVMRGIDEDNTATFSSSNKPSDQTLTTANLSGTVSSAIDPLNMNVTNMVQEIVNRSGWESGNAMGFVIADDGSSSNNWYSPDYYDNNPSNSATLQIEFVRSVLIRVRARYIVQGDYKR